MSNEIPREPVFAPTSWAIFDKAHIERYIQRNGTDPITGSPLTIDQLIRVYDSSPASLDDVPMIDVANGEMLHKELSSKLLTMRRQTMLQRQLLQKATTLLSRINYQEEVFCFLTDRVRALLPDLKKKLVEQYELKDNLQPIGKKNTGDNEASDILKLANKSKVQFRKRTKR